MRPGLRYRRVGTMTYEVIQDMPDDSQRLIGTVWRTRVGWSARTPRGALIVRDYPGSRATAAGNLASAMESGVGVKIES